MNIIDKLMSDIYFFKRRGNNLPVGFSVVDFISRGIIPVALTELRLAVVGGRFVVIIIGLVLKLNSTVDPGLGLRVVTDILWLSVGKVGNLLGLLVVTFVVLEVNAVGFEAAIVVLIPRDLLSDVIVENVFELSSLVSDKGSGTFVVEVKIVFSISVVVFIELSRVDPNAVDIIVIPEVVLLSYSVVLSSIFKLIDLVVLSTIAFSVVSLAPPKVLLLSS